MRIVMVRLIWLSFFSVCVFPSVGADSKALTVMTFNLRVDNPGDPTPWPERQKLIAEVVNLTGPDVMGTQEGLYHQVKDIAKRLPEYDWLGLGREGGSRGEFMAVFYRKARFEPLAFDHFWLSDTPELMNSTTWGNSIKRMVTWVQFKDLQTQQRFYLVNTHFDHRSQNARERSAELLRSRIQQMDASLPVIVTGDFNATSNNPAYKILTEDGFLKDTWYQAAQRKGEGLATFNGFKEISTSGSRIDWILSRGGIAVDLEEIVTWNKNGVFPSDHCPLLARLRFTGESQ